MLTLEGYDVHFFLHVWRPGGETARHGHEGAMAVTVPFGDGMEEEPYELDSAPIKGRRWDGSLRKLSQKPAQKLAAGSVNLLHKGKGAVHVLRNTSDKPVVVGEFYFFPHRFSVFTHVNTPIPVEAHKGFYYIRRDPTWVLIRPLGKRLSDDAERIDSAVFVDGIPEKGALEYPVFTSESTALAYAEDVRSYIELKKPEVYLTREGSVLLKSPPTPQPLHSRGVVSGSRFAAGSLGSLVFVVLAALDFYLRGAVLRVLYSSGAADLRAILKINYIEHFWSRFIDIHHVEVISESRVGRFIVRKHPPRDRNAKFAERDGYDPLDRKNFPKEQNPFLWRDGFHAWRVSPNPRLSDPFHFVAALDEAGVPQDALDEKHLADMFLFAQKSLLTVFSNGKGAGSSIPGHLHFQAMSTRPPVMDFQVRKSTEEESVVGDYPSADILRSAYLYESRDPADLGRWVAAAVGKLESRKIPYDVVARAENGLIKAYLFPVREEFVVGTRWGAPAAAGILTVETDAQKNQLRTAAQAAEALGRMLYT